MERIAVDDPADPRIEVFLGLRDHERRQARERPGGDLADTFVAEGDLVIERAIEAGHPPKALLIDARRTKPLPSSLAAATAVYTASPDVLTVVTGRPELRDPLAVFDRPERLRAIDLLDRGRTFAVLEGVNNPNNLGVIARNAAGLGIDALLLDPTCGDPLYRRAIRASMGQIFAIPHARLDPLPAALGHLHERGIATIALTPDGDTDISDVEAGSRTAIVLGAEGPGLTAATLAAASIRARIPMANDVDSLNVASAAAIAFHLLAQTDRAPG